MLSGDAQFILAYTGHKRLDPLNVNIFESDAIYFQCCISSGQYVRELVDSNMYTEYTVIWKF